MVKTSQMLIAVSAIAGTTFVVNSMNVEPTVSSSSTTTAPTSSTNTLLQNSTTVSPSTQIKTNPVTTTSLQSMSALSNAQLTNIAEKAYIYGYAAVANYAKQSKKGLVNKASNPLLGSNTFLKIPVPFDYLIAKIADIPAPNHDTLYSDAVADLRAEPVVLTIPKVTDPKRYYSLQLMDLNTNVLPYISSQTTGGAAGTYLLVGPNYTGATPTGFTGIIRSPSNFVTIIGRVEFFNTLDVFIAADIQSKTNIQTLSQYKKTTAPTPAKPLTNYNATTHTGMGYFTFFNYLLGLQPLSSSDSSIAFDLAQIGLGNGLTFNPNQFTAEQQQALLAGLTQGLAKIKASDQSYTKKVNGWVSPSGALGETGSFGTNYLGRACVADVFLYGNAMSEAWYTTAHEDANGNELQGKKSYKLHFAAGQLPPSKYFWSVTAYGSDLFFIPNLYRKYNVGSDTEPKFNKDGSLDIYIQPSPPILLTKFNNWLPNNTSTPISLTIRSYGPEAGIVYGTWTPPSVITSAGE